MYTIILFRIVCRMNKHKCDIDFEKHTPLMHVKLLVEKKTNYTSSSSRTVRRHVLRAH